MPVLLKKTYTPVKVLLVLKCYSYTGEALGIYEVHEYLLKVTLCLVT